MLLSSGVKARRRGAIMKSHGERPPTARLERLVGGYRHWLVTERSLAAATVSKNVGFARLFLSEVDDRALGSLTLADVSGFVVRHASRLSVANAKNLGKGLRSLLDYLYLQGLTDCELASGVPTPSGPKGGNLPRWLPAGEVAALVAVGQDDTTAMGRRDHAMVVMLARLGLRAAEVAGLSLDDLDWGAGEITIRGKGGRSERLPLPVDVGEALVGYLRQGRPPTACRAVFVGVNRPHTALASSTVGRGVRRACARAGITPVGAHRLRHSAATSMLRAGASLEEVGQVLRQRSSQVTALYAKVDFGALRALALPWPGGRP
jgi:site-specific recombinase XerD